MRFLPLSALKKVLNIYKCHNLRLISSPLISPPVIGSSTSLWVPRVTSINFVITIPIHNQQKWSGSPVGEKGKLLPRLPPGSLRFRPCGFFSPFSLNEEPGPGLGEFVCGYWDLKVNPFTPGDFAEKRVLKLVEQFSGHCGAIKS